MAIMAVTILLAGSLIATGAFGVNGEMMTKDQEPSGKVNMVQIVEFSQDDSTNRVKPIFHPERVTEVIKRHKNMRFLVISIIGPKRSGKSFLTNLFINFLKYLQKNPSAEEIKGDGWLNDDGPVTGVDWRKNRDAVTQGIWIWKEALLIDNNGKKIGVILMDCQGLYDADQQRDRAMDALVTLFALQISKIHIVNLSRDIRSNDLVHLETSVTFAQVSKLTQMVSKLFNTLIVLHRDWQEDDDLGRRGDYFKHLERKRTLTESEKQLKEAFKMSIEYMLPLPGSEIRHANSGDAKSLRIKDLLNSPESRDFITHVKKLSMLLFNDLASNENNLINQPDLMIILQKLQSHYADGRNIPEFKSPSEVLEYNAIMEVLHIVENKDLPAIRSFPIKSEADKNRFNEKIRSTLHFIDSQQKEMGLTSGNAKETWRSVRQDVQRQINQICEQKKRDYSEFMDESLKTYAKYAIGSAFVAGAAFFLAPVGIVAGIIKFASVSATVINGFNAVQDSEPWHIPSCSGQ